MRQVVKILPKRALYRENLALYAAYSGDFQTAEQEARAMQEPGAVRPARAGLCPDWDRASCRRRRRPIEALGKIDELGASYAASGLGDLALYEGRFADAARILAAGRGRRPGVQGPRPGRQQVRRARLRAGPATAEDAPPSRPPTRRWRTASREDPIPGGARVRRGRRCRQSPDALGRPRRRAPGRASGLCRESSTASSR